MNGVHDMGGMHGFGPVVREENEPVFHEPWEGRVYAMIREVGSKYVPAMPGIGRDIIERIEPTKYLTMSYYERWLHQLETRTLDAGFLTKEEIDQRMRLIEREGGDPVPPSTNPDAVAVAMRRLKTPSPVHKDVEGSRFALGDAIVVRNLNWPGHSRVPRYIRGKHGVIERVNGVHKIEDAHADALGPNPQTVYTVRFDGKEVWGDECETNLVVYLELWEGYMEPDEGENR